VTWWLYMRGGVAYLVEHRALFGRALTSAREVHFVWVMLVAAQFAGMIGRVFAS
jgi:hypothetical protein